MLKLYVKCLEINKDESTSLIFQNKGKNENLKAGKEKSQQLKIKILWCCKVKYQS